MLQFGNPILAGVTLARPAIQSPGYQPGAAGWALKADGDIEVNEGTFRSTVTIEASSYIYNGPPAAGNLVESVGVPAGVTHDPTGHNAVLTGDTNYVSALGGTAWLALQKTGGSIAAWTATTQAGPYTRVSTVNFDTFGNITIPGTVQVAAGVVFIPATSDPTGAGDRNNINGSLVNGYEVHLNPAATYYIDQTLAPAAGAVLDLGGATIQPGSAWNAAGNPPMIAPSGNNARIRNGTMSGGTGVTTSNPVADAIDASGVQGTRVTDMSFANINGWLVNDTSTAGVFNADTMIRDLKGRNCAGGIKTLGVAGTSYHSEPFLSNIQLQQMGVATGGAANLDAILIQDAEDILGDNINVGMASVNPGTGKCLHIAGNVATCLLSNVDIGGAGTVMLIEDSGGNSPSNVQLSNGTIQESTTGPGLEVTGGAIDIEFSGMRFSNNFTHGASLDGTGTPIRFLGCTWRANNQAGVAGNYDLNATQSALFYVKNSGFHTAVGTPAAGVVANVINDTQHQGIFEGNEFAGAGSAPSLVFAATPQVVRNCRGYNPRGQIATPAIGASPATINTSQNDVAIIWTALGGLTAVTVNSTSVPLPAVGQWWHLPARTSLVLTYTTTPPTMTWLAD